MVEAESGASRGERSPVRAASGGVGGDTEITGNVVAAIAGHAAAQVPGVIRIGGGNVLRSLTEPMMDSAGRHASGVDVESGRREAILDLDLAVEYGNTVPEIVEGVRRAIASELYEQAGLLAKEVNIRVTSMEFPESGRARVA